MRRGTRSESLDGSAARELAPILEPIQVLTADRHIKGWIVAVEDRVSDLLNRRQMLRICTDPAADQWESVGRDEILLVAPPMHADNPQRRVHRRRERLVGQLGSYVVSGVAHLPPGAELEPYLLRRQQPFLALTNATVRHAYDSTFDQELAVAIVNVGRFDELRAMLAPA